MYACSINLYLPIFKREKLFDRLDAEGIER